jgi:hypothetical protein
MLNIDFQVPLVQLCVCRLRQCFESSFNFFLSVPFGALSRVRHLFNRTNQMHTTYLIDAYAILFLRVSVYLTPSSGRTWHIPYSKPSAFTNLLSLNYVLITNLMHKLLFIHIILHSSTCFEP